MLAKEIKKPMIVGLILYGIAVLISLLCVLFQSAVFDFMNGYAVDQYLDHPVFPLITVFRIVVFLLFAIFTIIIHKYKGSSERLIGILLICVYCVINVVKPFVLYSETYMIGLFGGEIDLAASSTLTTNIEMLTLPFVTVSTALVFIAAGRYGVKRDILELTSDNKLPNKVKIPIIVAVSIYSQALLIDVVSVIFQQAVYEHWKAHIDNIFVFPLASVFQIIIMTALIAFMLVMLKLKGLHGQKAGIVMTVIYCVIIVAEPFTRTGVAFGTLGTLGPEYIAASIVLEKFIALYTAPFTTVSAVFLFISIGRYGMIKRENNDNSDI